MLLQLKIAQTNTKRVNIGENGTKLNKGYIIASKSCLGQTGGVLSANNHMKNKPARNHS